MKKIVLIFPKNSEALFNNASIRTFGGASVQMYLLAKEMKNNPEIKPYSLICEYDRIDFNDADAFYLVNGSKESDSFPVKVIKTHRVISRIKPYAIIQHGLTYGSCLMALYCRLRKIRFVFMFAHDVEVNKRFQSSGKRCYIFNLLIKFSSTLIVQNRYQLDTLKDSYKRFMNKVILLYNGFPVKKKAQKKEKNILWVARSDKWKRPELFIKLASLNPDCQFTMICLNSGDNVYYDMIVKLSESVPNINFIKFVAFNEIDKYFEKAYMFVNTSDYEGFPQTFIQAVMNGVPILSLNVDPDNFIAGSNCGKVLHGNFEKMDHEFKRIMNDTMAYRIYSDNAYNYFMKHHDVKENVTKLIKTIG